MRQRNTGKREVVGRWSDCCSNLVTQSHEQYQPHQDQQYSFASSIRPIDSGVSVPGSASSLLCVARSQFRVAATSTRQDSLHFDKALWRARGRGVAYSIALTALNISTKATMAVDKTVIAGKPAAARPFTRHFVVKCWSRDLFLVCRNLSQACSCLFPRRFAAGLS